MIFIDLKPICSQFLNDWGIYIITESDDRLKVKSNLTVE